MRARNFFAPTNPRIGVLMAEVHGANKMKKEQGKSNLSICTFIALTAVFAGLPSR
jgi:hypothetical protein